MGPNVNSMFHPVMVSECHSRRILALTVLPLTSVFFLQVSSTGRILTPLLLIGAILMHQSLLSYQKLRNLPSFFLSLALEYKQLSFHVGVSSSEFLVLLENTIISGTILLDGFIAGEIDDLRVVGKEGAVIPVLFHS